jgi:hypothetical protein
VAERERCVAQAATERAKFTSARNLDSPNPNEKGNKPMSEQDNTFSWKRDFKNINWPATLKYNALRAAAAGIVWCIFQLMAGAGVHALPTIIAFPIGYFIFLLPIGLVTAWLSGMGVPWVGLVNFLFALMLVVGDPLVFILKKMKPEFVPVEKTGFVNFKLVIFIIDEPLQPPLETAGAFQKGISPGTFK